MLFRSHHPSTVACYAPVSTVFSRQEYWSGLPFIAPRDLPTQGLNLGLLHRRRILYHLSHQGSPDLSLLQIIFQMATRGQTGAEHRLKINKPSLGRIKSFLTALLPCLSSLPSCSSQESRILSTYFPFATFSLPVLSSRTPPHPSILSLSLSFKLRCAVISHSVVSDPLQLHELWPTRLLCPRDFPGKNTGVGSHSLFSGDLPISGIETRSLAL